LYSQTSNRFEKKAYAVSKTTHKAKTARKQDMLAAGEDVTGSEDSSASAGEDNAAATSPIPNDPVMYSFDHNRGPTNGSQILNTALAQAMEKYEDKETTDLIRKEYEILDSDGEKVGLTPIKKGKGKAKDKKTSANDEDYEFV